MDLMCLYVLGYRFLWRGWGPLSPLASLPTFASSWRYAWTKIQQRGLNLTWLCQFWKKCRTSEKTSSDLLYLTDEQQDILTQIWLWDVGVVLTNIALKSHSHPLPLYSTPLYLLLVRWIQQKSLLFIFCFFSSSVSDIKVLLQFLLLICWHCLQKHSIYCSLYKLQSYWIEYNLKWQNNLWRSTWYSVEFLLWWACHADPRCIKKSPSKVTAPFAMMAHNKRITY